MKPNPGSLCHQCHRQHVTNPNKVLNLGAFDLDRDDFAGLSDVNDPQTESRDFSGAVCVVGKGSWKEREVEKF